MRKIRQSICVLVCLGILVSTVLAGDPSDYLGRLTYWYSNAISDGEGEDPEDVNKIGFWASTPYVYIKNAGDNVSFGNTLFSCVRNGISQWGNALNLTILEETDAFSANISFFGGTFNELLFEGVAILDADSVGVTTVQGGEFYEGWFTWSTNEIEKSCYSITWAQSALIKGTRTSQEYLKTAVHELGHALGYYGHDNYYSSIMTQTINQSNIYTTLNSRDINHLKQVYDRMNGG